MRRCLETACLVVSKCSAIAFGVIACNAINAIIARLVGSAMAWKMSRFITSIDSMQPNGCGCQVQPNGFANLTKKRNAESGFCQGAIRCGTWSCAYEAVS